MLNTAMIKPIPCSRCPSGSVSRGISSIVARAAHAWAVREALDLLTRVFPMRTCSKGVYNRHESLGRPCLLGYIGKCNAPCIGRVSEDEHRETVNQLVSFMNGNTGPVVRQLTAQM